MQCIAQKLDAVAEYNVILVFTNIKIMYFILVGMLDIAQYKINYLVCTYSHFRCGTLFKLCPQECYSSECSLENLMQTEWKNENFFLKNSPIKT